MAHRRHTVNITTSYARAAVYEGRNRSKDIRWDRQVPALGLRIQPSGAKSWTLEYRTPRTSKRRFMSLGHYPEVGPETARNAARDALHQVHVEHTDPLAEAARQATDPEHVTWNELLDRAEPEYLEPQKSYKSRQVYLGDLRRRWGSRTIASVSVAETETVWVEMAETRGPSAARTWDAIRRGILKWAVERARPRALVSLTWQVPTVSSDLMREHPRKCGPRGRTEYVPTAQIPQVWSELQELPWRQRGILQLMLLTGHRAHTIRHWRRSALDKTRKTITASVHKTVRTAGNLEILLSDAALDVLGELPVVLSNDWLFPADDHRGGYRSDIPITHQAVWQRWDRVRRKLNLRGSDGEYLKPHDLRHTVGSYLAASGFNNVLIGGVLAHADSRSSDGYIHPMEETQRAAVETLAKIMLPGAKSNG